MPIETPQRELHSWFVPVTIGDTLVGFLQLLPDLTLLRYSSFQRRDDSLEGCPSAESWIDIGDVRRRAGQHARRSEKAGTPFLTYDGAPSRLAWAVPLTSRDGATRTLFVAGTAVWETPPAGDPESYGGR